MKSVSLLCSLVLALAVCAAGENPVIPFLAVTGRPTEAELVRKVAALKADGFDAFLIYARSGLQETYLGERWFEIADILCREADRRDMKVWLYDEYNWPSGTCRGRVPNEDARYRYAEWAVYREKDGAFRWQRVLAPRGWVNVLDDGAMARFIELTHEVYAKRLAKWFDRKLIRGIFTDEPGHPTAIAFEGKPLCSFRAWEGLESAYAARTGRDFRRDVEAFLDGKGSAAVWETYAQLQGERFRTNYFDRIDAWCRRMGVASTGHLIAEDSLTASCRYNGNPLVALKGESLPGMDEIGSRTSNAEWLTLAVAQHAAMRKGRGGLVELFALGPNDMTAARLRQMIWLEALHGVDHYLASMQIMDHRGLVEKHGYLSPVQEGQPWHRETHLLIDDAKAAAAFARRTDVVRAVAVRYPQKAAARATYAGEKAPPLNRLLGELNCRQLAFDLVEEDEATDLPHVFAFDGTVCRETRTGTAFPSVRAAAEWLVARTRQAVRYYEADGTLATNLLVRTCSDGSSVALDVLNAGERHLFAEVGGVRRPCVLPGRGVIALAGGAFPPEPEDAAEKGFSVSARDFAYRLDRPNAIRLGFDTNNVARFTVTEPLTDVRFALRSFALAYAVTASGRPVDAFEAAAPGEKVIRHDAVPYSFELDGRPLGGTSPARVLPVEFNPLYCETEPLTLAAGPHALRLVTGESDRNFFLPAAFVSGAIARRAGGIGRLPARLGFGSLADQGLGDFCGAVTYRLEGVTPRSRTLRLATGGGFTRVRWQGADLGVRAWDPFDWRLPSAEPGTLDVTVYTSVARIFGDVKRPGADWDTYFWVPTNDPEHRDGLYAPGGEYDSPVRPVGEDSRPAWNVAAKQFTYAPTFAFKRVGGAVRYRFSVAGAGGVCRTFEAARPTAPLTPVWAEIPVGDVCVTVKGLAADGREVGLAGMRRFWKMPPFREGAYPKAARGYGETADLIWKYIFNRPYLQYMLDTGKPDPSYPLNSYPAKMLASQIWAMLRVAKLNAADAPRALRIAKAAADRLIARAEPEGSPLAHFPQTYDGRGEAGNGYVGEKFAGLHMLHYPAAAGEALLDCAAATGETAYRDFAIKIADTYVRLQGGDGTWCLKMDGRTGKSVCANRLVPIRVLTFLERVAKLTGRAAFAAAAERAFGFIERGPLSDWNWEGQFEDIFPAPLYANLTKHGACDVAIYLLRRFPGDARRLAQARELLRWSEDQFVVWDGRYNRRDIARWTTPVALEQYHCYQPIDESAAKLVMTYLALYRAERNPRDLAKARALGDAFTRVTLDDGRLRTYWNTDSRANEHEDWVNGQVVSALALEDLATFDSL